ncbi:MAG: hypothetical protein K2W96_26450 [Gemmataceae bacterium]|nr:hypothetical protein [Gemmataceae bacterium]
MADHDQRMKTALREAPLELLALAAPDWAALVESAEEWLSNELYPDPPTGERRVIDLLAPLKLRRGERALLHVEVESGDSVEPLRWRMRRYRPYLKSRFGLPVLSVGVYMSVGLEGIGRDEGRDEFAGELTDLVRWPYLGLPALDGTVYAGGTNLLGVAMVGLMRVPEAERPRIKAEAMLRVYESGRSDICRFLFASLIEAYMDFEDGGPLFKRYNALIRTEKRYETMLKAGLTTYERGQRDMVLKQIEVKFGPLPETAQRRLNEWPIERVTAAGLALLGEDPTLAKLGLVDEPKA